MTAVGAEFLILGTRQDQGGWTPTASSEAAGFPVENLLQAGYSTEWRSIDGDTSAILTFDRGASPPPMAGIAFAGCNFTPGVASSLILRASNNSGFTSPLFSDLDLIAVDESAAGVNPRRAPWGNLAVAVFPEIASPRYLRLTLDDPTNVDGYLRISAITGGGYWQASCSWDYDRAAQIEGPERSQVLVRSPNFLFQVLSPTETADFENVRDELRTYGRFAWVPKPLDRTSYPTLAGYGMFRELPFAATAANSGGALFSVGMSLIEATY